MTTSTGSVICLYDYTDFKDDTDFTDDKDFKDDTDFTDDTDFKDDTDFTDVKDFKDLKNPFPNFAGSSSGTGDSVNFDLYDEVCRGTFVV